jgi:protein-serine/threonine kinase
MPSPGPAAAGYRSPGGFNDVTNGLAHQFQHQNLGGNTPRSASPYRHPSPAGSRPRTGGQPQYGNYLNAAMALPPQGPSIYDEEPPTKNSEKYSTAITERVKLQKMLTQEFFKENVERARARNERYTLQWSFNSTKLTRINAELRTSRTQCSRRSSLIHARSRGRAICANRRRISYVS